MHIMWKDVFKFEILTLHEPKTKNKMAANKFKMVAKEFK